ncbi:MAG: hypothetical protein RSE15_08165 [Flavobacterium sp.]|uniref:hypothetical protein n=1 Tax=Flavobacterium sp. TaxID=239 RepID=UPI002B467824|nr:hypothetical protein [Flavobacterium sp.]WRH72339.1 MAG: hypothetical protein RSE15_08165 [Flavobacterium sp.]
MDKMLKYASILIILISFVSFYRTFQEYKILNSGNKISVSVFSVPISCSESSKTSKAYFTFYFNEKKQSKRLEGRCSINVGDKINLITNETKDIFLFEDEDIHFKFLAGLLIFVAGIYCYFKASK